MDKASNLQVSLTMVSEQSISSGPASTPALETKLQLGMLEQFEEQEVLERAGDPRRPEETGRVGIKPLHQRILTGIQVNNSHRGHGQIRRSRQCRRSHGTLPAWLGKALDKIVSYGSSSD